jgi:hypothetical protein
MPYFCQGMINLIEAGEGFLDKFNMNMGEKICNHKFYLIRK